MPRSRFPVVMCVVAFLGPGLARAEEPILERFQFVGPLDFFATGGSLAIDGPDADTTNVDIALHPGLTAITALDVPLDAVAFEMLLYWGGSIDDDDCGGATIDDAVTFTPPGGAPTNVIADVCYCSDAGSLSYDMQLCRADVSALIGDPIGDPIGEYALDDFAAQIGNASTNNASFSLVLVYGADALPARRIAVYDGLLTMWNGGTSSQLVVLDSLDVDDPPRGDLTWYALEGDVSGTGNESVAVVGKPGNVGLALGDAFNPVDNPMNHTVNTSTPPQVDALGVDIDQFDISLALSAGDTSIETTYNGGSDKYWIAYNVVGVNIYAPVLAEFSSKDWVLEIDADQDGVASPGDTIRYRIHLENTGDALGTVTVNDPIPSEAASWMVIDAGGGVDVSTSDTLIIEGLVLAPGDASDVIFDVVIADVPNGTQMINVANYETVEGEVGSLIAPPVLIAVEGGDTTSTDTGDTTSTDTGDTTSTDSMDTGDSGSGSGGDTGSTGTSEGSGANDEVGETGTDVGPNADGCSCSTGSSGPLGFGFGVVGLLGWLRRRSDKK